MGQIEVSAEAQTSASPARVFALLKDGRIRSITGFLDQVPAGV